MSHITKLHARSFKGQTFTREFSPLVHITGANWSGKSTILDAIRLAILGHLPELGKTNEATFDLSDGVRLAVEATLSDGQRIEREWTADGKGIRSSGTKQTFQAPMLNAAAYFGMTESERLAYVTAHMVLPEGSSASDILRDLKAAIPAVGEEGELARDIILSQVDSDFRVHATVQDALKAMLDKKSGWLAADFTRWNNRQKDTIGAVRTYTELKNREGECSSDTIADIEEELRVANEALQAALQRQGGLARARMDANRAQHRKTELEAVITRSPIDRTKLDQLQASLAAIKKRAPLPEGRSVTALRDAWDEIIENYSTWHSAKETLVNQRGEIEKQQEELEHLKACPFCQSKGKTWKKTLADKYEQDLALANLDLRRAEETLITVTAEKAELRALLTERESLENAEQEARMKERQLEADVLKEEQRLEGDTHGRKLAKDELARLTIAQPTDTDIETLSGEVNTLTHKVQAIIVRRDTAKALQQDIRRAAEAFEEHQKAKANLEVTKAAGIFLREKQGQTVDLLMRSLLVRANALFDGIMKSPLAMHDGEIGYFNGPRFVTHSTFSGTEQALTYIAVATALSSESALRIVPLDEFGRLDPENKQKVMAALSAAVDQRHIDQVFVIDTVPTIQPGWQHIAL